MMLGIYLGQEPWMVYKNSVYTIFNRVKVSDFLAINIGSHTAAEKTKIFTNLQVQNDQQGGSQTSVTAGVSSYMRFVTYIAM